MQPTLSCFVPHAVKAECIQGRGTETVLGAATEGSQQRLIVVLHPHTCRLGMQDQLSCFVLHAMKPGCAG